MGWNFAQAISGPPLLQRIADYVSGRCDDAVFSPRRPCHKEFAEGRMRPVRIVPGHRDLQVARQFQGAWAQ